MPVQAAMTKMTQVERLNKGLFGKIVKKIYAEEDGSLSFVLQGDLELKVCVEDRNDEQND